MGFLIWLLVGILFASLSMVLKRKTIAGGIPEIQSVWYETFGVQLSPLRVVALCFITAALLWPAVLMMQIVRLIRR